MPQAPSNIYMYFILSSILFGFALAMDAFSVSVANGIADREMDRGRRLLIAGTFALFQTVMPLTGWLCVRTAASVFSAFERYIPYIAFLLLFYIGGRMIMEGIRGLRKKEEISLKLSGGELFVQGIATSLDALSVGFTIERLTFTSALAESLIIGVVTLIICLLGLALGRKAGSMIKGPDIAGGIVLIVIAFLQIFSTGDKDDGFSYISASVLLGGQVKTGLNPDDSLSVPTWFTRCRDRYFLVDCYHDRIIYSEDPDAPLNEWKVMTDEMDRGHTVAGDGTVYLADDTENDRIMVFEERDSGFALTQEFTDIRTRPHYIIYDEESASFLAWASTGGRMYVFRRREDDTRVYLTEIKEIPSLDGVYVRSFTIRGNEIYFPTATGEIIVADRDTFEIKERYTVPPEIGGMIQLSWIDDLVYLTVSTDITGFQDYATIVRAQDIKDLSEGRYEDVYESFIGGGTPYFITEVDGSYYLTEHRLPGHSLWRFTVEDGKIDAQTVF